jgi:[ribosomal protein S18]-alanine N-acetyltransferase
VHLFGNELAGYAGSWRVIEEAHITTIAVKHDSKRKKIAEALLNRILKDCYKNEIKYLTLEVRISNIPAIKLYEKYGFKSLGSRKGYYQNNNEDALIMWTENIFWDKFKLNYQEKIEKLKDLIIVNN